MHFVSGPDFTDSTSTELILQLSCRTFLFLQTQTASSFSQGKISKDTKINHPVLLWGGFPECDSSFSSLWTLSYSQSYIFLNFILYLVAALLQIIYFSFSTHCLLSTFKDCAVSLSCVMSSYLPGSLSDNILVPSDAASLDKTPHSASSIYIWVSRPKHHLIMVFLGSAIKLWLCREAVPSAGILNTLWVVCKWSFHIVP